MSGPQLDCRVVVSTRLHGRSASEMGLLWPKERQDTRAFYDPPRCLLPPLLLAFHLLALGLRLAFSFSFPWRSRKCCHRGSAARVYDLLVGVLSYPLCPSGVSLHSPFSVLGFSVLDSLFLCHAHLASSHSHILTTSPASHLLDNHLGYICIYVSIYLRICICAWPVDCAATEPNRTLCQSERQILFFGHFAIRSPSRRPELLHLVLLPVLYPLSCGAPGVPVVAFEVRLWVPKPRPFVGVAPIVFN